MEGAKLSLDHGLWGFDEAGSEYREGSNGWEDCEFCDQVELEANYKFS